MFDHVKFGVSDFALSKAFFLKADGDPLLWQPHRGVKYSVG